MPKTNHKNLLFSEKQRSITINGVRQKSTDTSTSTPTPISIETSYPLKADK